jgi:hypothetical protein
MSLGAWYSEEPLLTEMAAGIKMFAKTAAMSTKQMSRK